MAMTRRMTSSMRDWPAIAGACALLACFGCDLGEANVVTRSPDLGPALATALGGDAPSDEVTTDDSEAGEAPPSDASLAASDTRDAAPAGPDTSMAKDGADAVLMVGSDTAGASAEAGAWGETGDDCAAQGFVFCDDFEDGAVGWMSTGETWAVTDDPTSAQPNEVFAPAAPAASGAYVAAGAWQDMTVEVRVRVTSFGQAASSNRAEIYARYQDSGHFYAVGLRGDGKLGLRRNSSALGLAVDVTVATKQWHVLKIRVSGPEDAVAVEGYLDGALLVTATDTDGFDSRGGNRRSGYLRRHRGSLRRRQGVNAVTSREARASTRRARSEYRRAHGWLAD